MKLGLLGTGRIGAMHARTLLGLDEVDGLVVADAVPERAAELAGSLGDRKSTRLNSSHPTTSRMPSSA